MTATDPLNHTTTWVYDDRGNKTSETRPDSGITTFIYDTLNRLVSSTDPKNQTTQYIYGGTGLADAGNNLVKLTDARSNSYLFNYDLDNRKTGAIYPDSSHENWSFDPVGNVLSFTTRAGQIRTSTFDNRNRETLTDWSDATPDVTMTYDAAGRLLTMDSDASALSYGYDDANERTSEIQDVTGAAAPAVVGYTYDADGNRSSLAYPDGHTVAYAYTARNQVRDISVDGAAPLGAYGFGLDGNVTSKALENGTSTSYLYDDANRLLTVDQQKAGTSFARFDYTYNSVNNRTSVERENGLGDAFTYDAIDQLTGVQYDATTPGVVPSNPARVTGYDYDAVGNRTSVADDGLATAYSTNNLNEYTSVGTDLPAYDGNGNLASPSATSFASYSYDAQNRLISASDAGSSTTFVYDALNRCVSRTVTGQKLSPTTFYYYDGWNLIEERDSAGTEIAHYVHGIKTDELLVRVTPAATSYYHQDALGSTIALTDALGNVVERYTYDVYGAPTFKDGSGNVVTSSASGNRFLFTGREYLASSKLYDYRNRVYSPALGRFLQTDPIRAGGGDINFYRFVGNSPSNLVDPLGLYWREWGVAIGGAIGGGIAAGVSVPADVATFGGNVLATPAEIGAGASLGALGGAAIGSWLDAITANSSSNPRFGPPGGTSTTYQPNGEPKQIREYGDDGYPDRDTDFDHPHNGIQPHEHNWGRPEDGSPPTHEDRGEGQDLSDDNPNRDDSADQSSNEYDDDSADQSMDDANDDADEGGEDC